MNFGKRILKRDQSFKDTPFKNKYVSEKSYKLVFVFIDQIEGYFSQRNATSSGCTLVKGH